jgi:hypothetical protein
VAHIILHRQLLLRGDELPPAMPQDIALDLRPPQAALARSSRCRPVLGGRPRLARLPRDPRTAPPGSRWRWHARDAGPLRRTARAASRAARSPAITSDALEAGSLPAGPPLGSAAYPHRRADQAATAVATTRRRAEGVKSHCRSTGCTR